MECNDQYRMPYTEHIKFLTPSLSADTNKTYFTALEKAIKAPGVTNIAISGPYGAGKSSVIKTFLSKQEDEDKYIEISLGSFKSQKNPDAKINNNGNGDGEDNIGTNTTSDDIGQIIEKSILQQIFYKVEKSQVPHSRLRRIVNPESWTLTWMILGMILFTILAYLVFNPKYLLLIIGDTKVVKTGWLITTIVLFMGYLILHHIAKYLSNFKLEKITVKDAEFSLGGEKDTGSLINRHIDEILYFFETTKFKYLIIEDLDRYNNIEIYEKLRELNTLVNNYDKIKAKKEKIIFIYAIKDDFFVGENRSKFFNIIIPIVPYINATGNARDLLVKDLREAGISEVSVSDQLLKDISKFIHDRRLLINIINEFLVYLNELNPTLGSAEINPEKLFCIIVYKNFFPGDFSDLHQSKGWLFDVFNKKKRTLQEKLVKQLDERVKELQTILLTTKQEFLTTELELRGAILMRVLADRGVDFRQIYMANNWYTQYQVASSEALLEMLINGGQFTIQNINSQQISIQIASFKDQYLQRIDRYKNNSESKIKELKDELALLQIERSVQLAMDISDLMKKIPDHGIFSNQKILYKKAGYSEEDINYKLETTSLLSYFIREGKISEDYANYISYYHEGGSLSRSDNNFIIGVIEGQEREIDYNIDNPELVIDELSDTKFLTPSVLNVHIIGALFANQDKYKDRCSIASQLLENRAYAHIFIPSFISSSVRGVSQFLKYSAERSNDFWKQLENLGLDRYELFNAVSYLLEHCSKETLLAQGAPLSNYIFRSGELLFSDLTPDQNFRLLSILPDLDGKFSKVKPPITDEGEKLFSCMVNFSLYEINPHMIATIIMVMGSRIFGENTPDEQISEYSNIQHSNIDALKHNIEVNIDEYVRNIYLLTLGSEIYPEDEVSICNLINHSTLNRSLKLEIINQMSILIDVTEIQFDEELFRHMYTQLKVVPTWENVFNCYSNMGNTTELDESLATYLSNFEIASALTQTKLPNAIPYGINEIIFSKALVFDINMKPEVLSLYRLSINPFDDISNIGEISEQTLSNVYKAKFINFTRVNYEYLRLNTSQLYMHMLEPYFEEALDFIFELPFDESEALRIIDNKNIIPTLRYEYLSKLDLSLVNIMNFTNSIGNLIYSLKPSTLHSLDYKLFDITAKSSLSIDNKIHLFMRMVDRLSTEQIYEFLNDLEGHYADLRSSTDGKKSHSFANNKSNRILFKKLEEQGIVWKIHDVDKEIIVEIKKEC